MLQIESFIVGHLKFMINYYQELTNKMGHNLFVINIVVCSTLQNFHVIVITRFTCQVLKHWIKFHHSFESSILKKFV